MARDPHDLLGHQLAAILLKAEVAKRLAVSDPGRSDAELRQLGSLAGKTSQELRCQAAAED